MYQQQYQHKQNTLKKNPRGFEVDATDTEALQGNGFTDGMGNGLFGDGRLNIDKNLVNICVNFNYNEQEDDGFKKPHPVRSR